MKTRLNQKGDLQKTETMWTTEENLKKKVLRYLREMGDTEFIKQRDAIKKNDQRIRKSSQ